MNTIDSQFKWINPVNPDRVEGGVAHEYVNSLTALEYMRLLDEVNRTTAAPSSKGLALHASETSTGCSRHPDAKHSDSECKAQKRDGRGAAASKPKNNPNMVCYKCGQTGHPYWKCLSAVVATAPASAKVGKSKAATKKSGDGAAHAAPDISAVTAAVLAALDARTAALASSTQVSDDGNPLHRANAFSACSKLILPVWVWIHLPIDTSSTTCLVSSRIVSGRSSNP